MYSCLNDNNNLYDEIRRQRKCKQTFTSTIYGQTDDIPGYKSLYNSIGDISNLSLLEDSLECEIDERNLKDVNLITTDMLKSAMQRLTPGKTDTPPEIISDCFRGAPDILYAHLTTSLKSVIIHGHVSEFLLMSTLIPIIKDKLGDITKNSDYRSIAISSLIYDLVIYLYNKHLHLDDLQYS